MWKAFIFMIIHVLSYRQMHAQYVIFDYGSCIGMQTNVCKVRYLFIMLMRMVWTMTSMKRGVLVHVHLCYDDWCRRIILRSHTLSFWTPGPCGITGAPNCTFLSTCAATVSASECPDYIVIMGIQSHSRLQITDMD